MVISEANHEDKLDMCGVDYFVGVFNQNECNANIIVDENTLRRVIHQVDL